MTGGFSLCIIGAMKGENMYCDWFNRLGVRAKLFLSNLLMVVIPVVIILLVTISLWGLLRYTNPINHRGWVMLAPSSLQAQVFQYELEQINKKLSHPLTSVDDIRNNSAIIEAQGLDIAIYDNRGNMLYETPGCHANSLLQKVALAGSNVDHKLLWADSTITYYNTYGAGLTVIGYGHIPFLAKNMAQEDFDKKMVEAIFGLGIILFIIFVIGLGMFLSIRLSRYILRPLNDLKEVANGVREGHFNQSVSVRTEDELGALCQGFNHMLGGLVEAYTRQRDYENRRRQMIAGICHDLSTPLTSVKGYSCGLLEGVANSEDKRKRYAQTIYEMASRMEDLVDLLSEFSQLELKQITYEQKNYSVQEVLSQFVESRHLLEEEDLCLLQSYPKESLNIYIDKKQFYRILDNLLSNSRKYKLKDLVTIQLAFKRVGECVRISFADDGPGVPENELSAIFDIFYRSDEARSQTIKGSGIGLAIVRQIVEDMGGKIWAEANDTIGLAIIMEFPLQKE